MDELLDQALVESLSTLEGRKVAAYAAIKYLNDQAANLGTEVTVPSRHLRRVAGIIRAIVESDLTPSP